VVDELVGGLVVFVVVVFGDVVLAVFCWLVSL